MRYKLKSINTYEGKVKTIMPIVIGAIMVVVAMVLFFAVLPRFKGNDVRKSQFITSAVILLFFIGVSIILFSIGEPITNIIGVILLFGSVLLVIWQWTSMIGKVKEEIEEDEAEVSSNCLVHIVDVLYDEDKTRFFMKIVEADDDDINNTFLTYVAGQNDFAPNGIYVFDESLINNKTKNEIYTYNGTAYTDVTNVEGIKFREANAMEKSIASLVIK